MMQKTADVKYTLRVLSSAQTATNRYR